MAARPLPRPAASAGTHRRQMDGQHPARSALRSPAVQRHPRRRAWRLGSTAVRPAAPARGRGIPRASRRHGSGPGRVCPDRGRRSCPRYARCRSGPPIGEAGPGANPTPGPAVESSAVLGCLCCSGCTNRCRDSEETRHQDRHPRDCGAFGTRGVGKYGPRRCPHHRGIPWLKWVTSTERKRVDAEATRDPPSCFMSASMKSLRPSVRVTLAARS